MPRPENMQEFFDKRSDRYDAHMEKSVASFKEIYTLVPGAVTSTERPIEILDIGCGTGLELEEAFRRAPNARITGIDLSPKMLHGLRRKYADRLEQMTLIEGSYLDYPFDPARYDYVISVMTLHHLLPDKKRTLYQQVRATLKPGGLYIEGDYIVSPEKEAELLRRFEELRKANAAIEDGTHHIDIPMSHATLEQTLKEAGFTKVRTIWSEKEAAIVTAGE